MESFAFPDKNYFYKHGNSAKAQQVLLLLKRFEDSLYDGMFLKEEGMNWKKQNVLFPPI